MASLFYEDTQPVRRQPAIARTQARRLTTQFAPERKRVITPWVIVIALWIAGVARPIDPTRSIQLENTATQLLGSR